MFSGSVIVELVVNIALGSIPLIIWIFDKKRNNEESEFISYASIETEKFIKKNRKKSYVFIAFLTVCYIVSAVNNLFLIIDSKKEISSHIQNIIVAVFLFALIVQFVLKWFVVFGDVKFINNIIAKKGVNGLNDLTNWSWVIAIVFVVVISFVITSEHTRELIIYTIICLCIALEANLSMFLALYVKLRYCYIVKEINIKIKSREELYFKIDNYKKSKDYLTFVVQDDNKKKRIIVHISEVDRIEKIIDMDVCLLDGPFKEWKINKKQK